VQEEAGAVRRVIRSCVAAALVVAAVGALAVTGIASPSGKRGNPEKVKVLDDFFNPDNLKIKKGKKVKWKTGNDFNTHNVTLKKGPNGVKKSKFTSQTSSSEGFTFTKEFKKPGKYNFYCTIHPDVMTMKVTVKG
jgi:plastocyanin